MWLTIGIMIGVAGTTARYTGADPVSSIGSALASGAVVQTIRRPWLLAPKHGIVRTVGARVGADIWHVAKAFAGTTTGGVVIGYTAGAAVGTIIVTEKFGWDPEGETMGGKDVLGFYTGGIAGPRPTKDQILTAYEYAPRTKPGKYLQYFPNITWLWGKENIAYI